MKKFLAILLPVILIGSLVTSFTVAACPFDDSTRPEEGWGVLARGALPQVVQRAIPTEGGIEFVVTPWQDGRFHPDGASNMRWTPAGRQHEENNNFVAVPAGQIVVSTGNDGVFAWTMACRTDRWWHVSWVQDLGFGFTRTHVGYMHSSQLAVR